MKTAYLGKIQLSDVDLSYLHEAQKLADITYIMEVCPRFLKGPAFSIERVYKKSGVFKAIDVYPEFHKYASFIDVDKFYVVNTCGRLWAIKSIWTHFLLLLFLIKHKFDVIHLVWPPNLYEFVLYFLRHKMILTVHDPIPHSGLNTFIVRLRRKFAFKLIPNFILLNKIQLKEFQDYYHISQERIFCVRLSCYTYLKTVTPSTTDIPPANSYILFAGKISAYKGIDYLLSAMKEVHEIFPECRLIVAGGGRFHFDISQYQSLDYIEFRNRFIPESELVALIKNCAFMVCPYTDATQSGVVMSAFAFDKPVIATNVGALPEMVSHQHYGLVVKEKDAESLKEGIAMLWEQAETTAGFSAEIHRDYNFGELSWRKTAEDIISFFKSRYI